MQRGTREDTGDNPAKLAKLLEETRSYAGSITLNADRSERGGRGFDVYLQRGDQRTNISDCGDDSCGHASLSGTSPVLYVRSPRY